MTYDQALNLLRSHTTTLDRHGIPCAAWEGGHLYLRLEAETQEQFAKRIQVEVESKSDGGWSVKDPARDHRKGLLKADLTDADVSSLRWETAPEIP